MKAIWLSVALVLASAPVAFAWGERGHSVVAEIAQRHLSAKAFAQVGKILGNNASMASVSSWADDYKFTPAGKDTYDWHFVDIDVTHPGYSPSDCPGGGCLVSALRDEARILGDASAPAGDRRQALMLLIHLVGDSSQPFHCGERDGDRGGNDFRVDYEGRGPGNHPHHLHNVRLHSLWDDTLVMDRAWNWGDYAGELDDKVVPNLPAVKFGDGFAEAWVNECHAVGVKIYALTPENGPRPTLGKGYQAKVDPIIDRQLALGGLRLAAMLNLLLGQ